MLVFLIGFFYFSTRSERQREIPPEGGERDARGAGVLDFGCAPVVVPLVSGAAPVFRSRGAAQKKERMQTRLPTL